LRPHPQPHIERQVEQLRLQEINVGYRTVKLKVLVRQPNLDAIEDIEEVGY